MRERVVVRARLVLLVVALAAVTGSTGCRHGNEPAAVIVTAPDALGTWGFDPLPSETLLVGMTPLRITAPVMFERATLVMDTGDIELLSARMSMFGCATCSHRPDIPAYAGVAGSSCSNGPWPPPGYGPTGPLEGFTVLPGESPSLVLYLKPRSVPALTKAVLLTYRDDHHHKHTLRIENERVEVKPANDADGDNCQDSLWFGGTHNPDVARVVTPSPTAS